MSYIDNSRFPILIISANAEFISDSRAKAITDIKEALDKYNYNFIHVNDMKEAVKLVKKENGLGCIIINENDFFNNTDNKEITIALIKEVRRHNANIPIVFSSPDSMADYLAHDVLDNIHENININEDTATFIAGRINLSIQRYIENLLPPYFKALKDYANDSPYYWDCPGHQGGVAYLKHPIGREFINYFGEKIMRADIGIATPEMGDWLEHKGPPGDSERRAAKTFGADKTFYVTGGSSQSNQIVGHSLYLKNRIVLVDRNCHKSVNHELTVTQAIPIYFTPSRNGLGIIGLISPEQFEYENIQKKIKGSPLSRQAESQEPAYAIVTNCSYDGLIYDVNSIVREMARSVARIKFDEAWYAYAKFHPLYKGRFAMDVPVDLPDCPTLYAVQSTHKMLAAFSSASMIHIRNSPRAPVDYRSFNESFMMHGTTSPFYPIIASIDVATAMMEGNAGESFINDAINDAINFRKAMIGVKNRLGQGEKPEWFFDVWQPETVTVNQQQVLFENAPNDVLAADTSCWTLKNGASWHGFINIPDDYVMLDPIKVTIICPGLDAHGQTDEFGIPAPVVSKYLGTQRIIPARNGDYNILILFALGSTQGKWGTLIEQLLEFKCLHDSNVPLEKVLPQVVHDSAIYNNLGLADLCSAIHKANIELDITALSARALSVDVLPVMTPSQAYEYLTNGQTEWVSLDNANGRIIGSMVTPYPPGIPIIMPGERITAQSQVILDYLKALQIFGQRFPGFEHELQGVEIDRDGVYWLRCINEAGIPRLT